MNFWNNFAAKHPAAAKWVREGGLFVIVSNLITLFKYLLLQLAATMSTADSQMLAVCVVVSLVTPAPTEDILAEFDAAK